MYGAHRQDQVKGLFVDLWPQQQPYMGAEKPGGILCDSA